MRLIAGYYGPDLILIPLGGHFTMDPIDAVFATKGLLKPVFTVPIDQGTTPVLQGTPKEYIKALRETRIKVFATKPSKKRAF